LRRPEHGFSFGIEPFKSGAASGQGGKKISRAGNVEMPGDLRSGFLAIGVLLMTALPGHAEEPTFSELLARAKAQAAAGHRWKPAGDNMTETVMTMMDLLPTASRAEIQQLSALLESGKSGPPTGENSDALSEERLDRAQAALAPRTTAALPAVATAAPGHAPGSSEAPARAAGPQGASNQVGPSQMGPSQMGPSQMGPSLMGPSQMGPSQMGPSQMGPGQVGPSQTGPSQIGPSQMGPSQIGPSQMGPGQTRPAPGDAGQMKPGQLAPGQVGPPQPPPAADSRAALLFARGLEAERRGDFSGARRFYLSSAQQGDAAAARNLGRLYDPAYLAQTALGGIDADPALAQRWYERAVRLGDADAGPLLEALSVR
jgi:TPR repeat protein